MTYKEYDDLLTTISSIIVNKENDIQAIEKEIAALKVTRRSVIEEFKGKVDEKPSFIGWEKMSLTFTDEEIESIMRDQQALNDKINYMIRVKRADQCEAIEDK